MGECKGCNGHLYGCQYEDNAISFCDDKDMTNRMTNNAYKHGYDAGYNQCELDWQKKLNEENGKYLWHDLRKNSEDLPNISKRIGTSKQIMFVDDEGYQYIGYLYIQNGKSGRKYKRWYADFCDDKIKGVIAWRDIEPFEGKE